MKWFKHFSKAKYDKKISRLINRYGLEGYGLYFAIVESIAFQLESTSPYPDLEEEAEDIAAFFRADTLKVAEMMKYMVDSDLLEWDGERRRVTCLKLLTHLDNTMSNNPEIKNILSSFKKLKETSSNLKQIRSDQIKLDKTREDQNNSGSAEAQPEAVYNFPCKDGSFSLTEEMHLEFAGAYKDIEVYAEYPKMSMWLISNKAKQKTKRGMLKFINSWLSRTTKTDKDEGLQNAATRFTNDNGSHWANV